MTDYGLSPKQVQVIDALSSGATVTAAAEEAGIHRNTIATWRRNFLPFQHALANAQYDRAMHYREKKEQLADLALDAVRQILAAAETAPSVRLRAALSVLDTAATPPEPKKQVMLDIEKIVVHQGPAHHVDEELVETLELPNETSAAQPTLKDTTEETREKCNILHNSAQSVPPATIRRDQPKVGRNEACPCGSGLKYKRCCIDKLSPVSS